MTVATDPGLEFTERMLELVNSARLSTTYKLATLMALFDVAAEQTNPAGGAPATLSGREVARRVIEEQSDLAVPIARNPVDGDLKDEEDRIIGVVVGRQ